MPCRSTVSTKSCALIAAKAVSKRCASTACTPYCASRRTLAGGRVSRNGPVSGTKKRRGWGSKVSTTSGASSARACSAAWPISAWWPRCTPSKLPSATVPPVHCGGIACQSSNTGIISPASNHLAPRHEDGGLSVDHHLVAVEALGLEGHAAAFLVDRGDGGDGGDGLADQHRRHE